MSVDAVYDKRALIILFQTFKKFVLLSVHCSTCVIVSVRPVSFFLSRSSTVIFNQICTKFGKFIPIRSESQGLCLK